MTKIIDKIMRYKKLVLTIFIIFFISCLFFSTKVKVNYNMMDYLPASAASTKALEVMEDEFQKGPTNTRVMMKDVTLTEALSYKKKLSKVEGVKEVNFLDDIVDLQVPLEMYDQDLVSSWYHDKLALFTLTIEEEKEHQAISEIEKIISYNGVMSGSTVNTVTAEKATAAEIQKIFLVVIPIILLILLLTTSSYFEPLLFLVTIGVAIILNMGTNLIFGEISFVTKAAASILQLAVSIDYSIFLLHKFSEARQRGLSVEDAMKTAVKQSISSILSSGMTTVVGFAALILMNFKIGPDMGIVMAKAIFFSLLCVLVLLPIIAVYSYRLIDKTAHKSFMPSCRHLAASTTKWRQVFCFIFILLVIPCYLGSVQNKFIYGSSKILGDETEVGKERLFIEKEFGQSNMMVLMVPRGDFAKEVALTEEVGKLKEVLSITSYVTTVGEMVPVEYVPLEQRSQLLSDRYSRIILTIDALEESDQTFQLIDKIKEISSHYYPKTYHIAGTSVSTYDLKRVVTEDNNRVNIVALVAIFVILLITFKSILLPFILLFVIEGSIWINLTYVYLAGSELNFIAYLIISSIQLGATIDYAILFTDHYLKNRATKTKQEATIKTISETFISILTSSSILMICGFMLGKNSSNGVISQLGYLIGRGAFISTILVIFVLPGLLILFDRGIEKTTKNSYFYKEEEK